jgi:3-oxoacyl-[acyl-carrier protein] reductase
MQMEKLKDKVALVTGSARGIGAAIAQRLAADGAAVAVNYARSASEAEGVAERIRGAGGKAIVLKADVGVRSEARSVVEAAARALGRLDILVNNAAELGFQPVEQIDETQLRRQLSVNVEGPIATMQAAAPFLPKDGGRVINITSLVQLYPLPGNTVYAAAKGAIDAMTRVWALELGPRGVTVNAVGPGLTDTDAVRQHLPEATKRALIERTPLGRIGTPSDIADVVAFLASHDARWITGQVLLASGGFTP